jgi:hypothetical protein
MSPPVKTSSPRVRNVGPAKPKVTPPRWLSTASTPVEVLKLKLSDRYSNVQRLHTHPKGAKQRSYYAETVEHFVPLATVDPRLDDLFKTWAETYEYLSEVEWRR